IEDAEIGIGCPSALVCGRREPIESGTVVLSCPPAVDINHREIHLGRGIAAAGSLLKPRAGLADVGSLSKESGNQTELVLSIDLALAGGNLERREVTGSLGEGPAIFGGAETGVRGNSLLPDCLPLGISCGSSSVRQSGQLTRPAAASSCDYRSERIGVGVGRCKT